jgi:hypothetical protein
LLQKAAPSKWNQRHGIVHVNRMLIH